MSFGLSVIIPVYNTDLKIFERCLSSVQHAFSNNQLPCEIIIVDDGSKIDYKKIITHYSKYLCLNYIKYQKNSGRSHARNLGIKIASYSWITFLDSDDEVGINYFDQFYINTSNATAHNLDFITFGYFINSNPVYRPISLFTFKPISYKHYHYFCTNTIFIRNSVLEFFQFDEKISKGEDLKLWNILLNKFTGYHVNIQIAKYNYDYKNYSLNGYYNFFNKPLKKIKYFIKFDFWGKIFRVENKTLNY